MPEAIPETVEAIEAAARERLARLRGDATEISARLKPAEVASSTAATLREAAVELRSAVRRQGTGKLLAWATGLGASAVALGFLPRRSHKDPLKTDQPIAAREADRTTNAAGVAAKPHIGVGGVVKTAFLGASGLLGGYALAAAVPKSSLEARVNETIGAAARNGLREFLDRNAQPMAHSIVRSVGLPQYSALGLVAIHLIAEAGARFAKKSRA